MTPQFESSEVDIIEENETSAPMISLTDAVTRWGNNKRIEGFEKLFTVKELKVRCQFQKGQSSVCCGKEFTSSRDTKGTWKISNFTNHFKTHLIDKTGQQSSRSGMENFLLKGIANFFIISLDLLDFYRFLFNTY